jgi:diguanylate cyclase (GGDEF)-like protein
MAVWYTRSTAMGKRPVVGPIDRLAGRITTVSRPALFAVFVSAAVLLGELLTAGVSLLVVGRIRWTALVIGFAAGFVTSAAAAAIVVRLLNRIGDLQGQLAHSAGTDDLTGLPNRRTLFEVLAREIERAGRRDAKLSVAFADLDRFKLVNDRQGHQVGDAVLRDTGAAIKAALRGYDVVARYGGDEFVMVLPDTGTSEGHAVAERIRTTVAAKVFTAAVRLTVSLGVASLAKGMDADRLLKVADAALYRAKRAGRNRSEVSLPQP